MNLNLDGNVYRSLLKTLNAGKKAVVVTTISRSNGEEKHLSETTLFTEDDINSGNCMDTSNKLHTKIQYAIESGSLQFESTPDNDVLLIEPYFPEPHLIVLGGGHIAKPLVEFAAKTGFCVTVVDDRPSFANKGRFPDADRVICESFENCFKLLNLNEASFVVIVTRGHRHDFDCLKQALKHNTAYVGMIGSKRRVKIVKEQLLNEGYSENEINKVSAPIGLDINAVTPEEIAIAIMAQVISYRRSRTNKPGSTASPAKVNWPEFDHAVIEDLAKGLEEPKAIITIVSTKGSVPRKEGARMIVYTDGRILGSIGGGCSEGEVINMARDIIRNEGYQIHDIDMTGYVAEEEGMVCGGIMKVLIESNNLRRN